MGGPYEILTMNDFLDELGAMELAPEETREILRRLAVEEFGGAEAFRVRDVAEVAEAPIQTVARILAELRGETLHAWKAQIETRLAALEHEPPVVHDEAWRRKVEDELASQRRSVDAIRSSSANLAGYYERLEEEFREKEPPPPVAFIFDSHEAVEYRRQRRRAGHVSFRLEPHQVGFVVFLSVLALLILFLFIRGISGR